MSPGCPGGGKNQLGGLLPLGAPEVGGCSSSVADKQVGSDLEEAVDTSTRPPDAQDGFAVLPLAGAIPADPAGAARQVAALFFWQSAPARNKIRRAQRRREVALVQRLQQQVSGHQSPKPPVSIPTGGSYLRTYPFHYLIPFRRQGAWGDSPPPSSLYTRSLCSQFLSIYVLQVPLGQGQCVFSVLPVPGKLTLCFGFAVWPGGCDSPLLGLGLPDCSRKGGHMVS